MKKLLTLLLIIVGMTFYGHAQNLKLSPLGVPVSEDVPAGTKAPDDIIMAYSSFTISNVLVLNGVDVPPHYSGWFSSRGWHESDNSNYGCGYEGTSFDDNFRNFHAFDLSNLAGYGISLPITSAVLHVQQYGSVPVTGVKTWNLSAVSTPYATINQDYTDPSPAGSVIFADLGEGAAYGSVDIDRTLPEANVLQITLNSTAIADINASAQAGEIFVVGGKIDDIGPTPVPVSNWAIILGVLLIGAFMVVRYRRRLA